ncbi:MAG: VWA domain-containing protein [Oligoflexia bacterium]|nr:VWA domain-containing protein [Oligoflexia bacterium]
MAPKKIQMGLMVDLTGSMAAVRGEVRAHNHQLVKDLFDAFPELEVGAVMVGDDLKPGYMVRHLPLSSGSEQRKITHFIDSVPNADGGDADECYELGLRTLAGFDWDPAAQKVVVAIGDSYPHSTTHPKNPGRLEWRKEAQALAKKGITIHAVQCLAYGGDSQAQRYWSELPKLGGGLHLMLEQFRHLRYLLLGIGHRTVSEENLASFTERLERDGSISVGLGRSFDLLLGRRSSRSRRRTDGRVPVEGSRFQVLTCTALERQDVRQFAVDKGLISDPCDYNGEVKGRVYYAHTERTETLRPGHHVVIQDRRTDEFFTGADARAWLGIPYGGSGQIPPNPLGPDYTVWIQSKSLNRKLFPGQEVMVDMTEMATVLKH